MERIGKNVSADPGGKMMEKSGGSGEVWWLGAGVGNALKHKHSEHSPDGLQNPHDFPIILSIVERIAQLKWKNSRLPEFS